MYTIQRPESDFIYEFSSSNILSIEEVYLNNKPLKSDMANVLSFISALENKDLSACNILVNVQTKLGRVFYSLRMENGKPHFTELKATLPLVALGLDKIIQKPADLPRQKYKCPSKYLFITAMATVIISGASAWLIK